MAFRAFPKSSGSTLLSLILLLSCGCTSSPARPLAGSGEADVVVAPPSESNHGQNASGGRNAPPHRDAPYVVLVSFDGFRPDYMELYPTPHFRRLAREGVKARSMIPVFPTKTFPGHYTLATGLYAENHGLVGNTFYDPEKDRWYRMSDRDAVEDASWYGGEPLWVTAERQGMVAASYYWVGSEAAVRGVRPTFWYRFDERVPGEARIDRVLEWLRLPSEERPHLITLYFSETDGGGHEHGPGTPGLATAVARADSLLGRLIRGLDELPHGDRVHLVVVSDHGMASFDEADLIELETARLPDVTVAASGPYVSMFLPPDSPGELWSVRDTLRAMMGDRAEVHVRQEMPQRFHYGGHPAAGDIVIVPGGTGMVVKTADVSRFRPGHTHGWDNRLQEMAALFLARGPGLPADTTIPAFESIHVYPFILHLLGLDSPPVDGRLEVLGSLLDGSGAAEGYLK